MYLRCFVVDRDVWSLDERRKPELLLVDFPNRSFTKRISIAPVTFKSTIFIPLNLLRSFTSYTSRQEKIVVYTSLFIRGE